MKLLFDQTISRKVFQKKWKISFKHTSLTENFLPAQFTWIYRFFDSRYCSKCCLFELPQALFQLVLYFSNDTASGSLILLSVAISVLSLVLQVLQLRSLAQKESFNSVFDLIQALARGTYIAGVNQIRNNSSSILNVTGKMHRSYSQYTSLSKIRDRRIAKCFFVVW